MILHLKQYHHESSTWQRLLDFLRQENAFLKSRLSEFLDSKEDKNFIPIAEQFQNEFLLKDDYIMELKKDINDLQKQFKTLWNSDEAVILPLLKKQDKLRNEMKHLETNFSELKNRFYDILDPEVQAS
ncbi:hypothetical protein BH09BAC2_BH09BAC2_17730 [soil metagenome]